MDRPSTDRAGRRSSPFEVIILNVTKKSSGALNEPSRNFEFCQPQCLKCVCAFLVEEFRFSGLAWLSFMKKNWNYPEILTLSQESMSACINLW